MPPRITKAEMLRSIRRLINIGRTGLVMITVKRGKIYKNEIRDIHNEDYYKEIYSPEFIKKLEKLEKEVEEKW